MTDAKKTETPWDSTINIGWRMHNARQELSDIKLGQVIQAQGTYEAISIHQLVSVCQPALGRHGINFSFHVQSWRKDAKWTMVEGFGRFASIENPDDHIDVETIGEGMDGSDKGCGKAISYARKNALIQGLNLRLGVDNELEDAKPDPKDPPIRASHDQPQATPAEPPQPQQDGVRLLLDPAGKAIVVPPAQVKSVASNYILEHCVDAGVMQAFLANNRAALSAWKVSHPDDARVVMALIKSRQQAFAETMQAAE